MTIEDKPRINAILNIIAKDDTLVEQFANALDEDLDDFSIWIDQIRLD